MKNKRSWLRTPLATGLILAAAIVLLATSGIGIAMAVPSIRTNQEYSNIAQDSIGVSLQEDGQPVSGKLMGSMLEQTEGKLVYDKEYSEPLRVFNSGEINEYVRVTVRKYWTDENGKKTDLSPELIHVTLNGQDLYKEGFQQNGWVADSASLSVDSPETVVLYYSQLLASGTPSSLFADSISIDKTVAKAVKTEPDGNTIRHIYKYDGVQFYLDVTVDAVQEHNAEYTDESGNTVGAIKSAWGVEASDVGINVG